MNQAIKLHTDEYTSYVFPRAVMLDTGRIAKDLNCTIVSLENQVLTLLPNDPRKPIQVDDENIR